MGRKRDDWCICQIEDQDDTRSCGKSTFAADHCKTHFYWKMKMTKTRIQVLEEDRKEIDEELRNRRKELREFEAAEIVET